MRIGKPGSTQYLEVYDKKAHREFLQRSVSRNQSQLNPGRGRRIYRTTTRFEFRVSDIGSVAEAASAPLPFASYTVRQIDGTNRPTRFAHEWDHFMDSCRYRGLQNALSLIQESRKRVLYRDAIRDLAPPPWWNVPALEAEARCAIAETFAFED